MGATLYAWDAELDSPGKKAPDLRCLDDKGKSCFVNYACPVFLYDIAMFKAS